MTLHSLPSRLTCPCRRAFTELLFKSSTTVGSLSYKDFEAYRGSIELLSVWVFRLLETLLEPVPPAMMELERRYSSVLESEELMRKHNLNKKTIEHLRKLFYLQCAAHSRAELTSSGWLEWTVDRGRLAPDLAALVFQSRLSATKQSWRFIDFATFCVVFGSDDTREKLRTLVAGIGSYLKLEPRQAAEVVARLLSVEGSEARGWRRSGRRRSVLRGDESNGSLSLPLLPDLAERAPLPPSLQAAIAADEEGVVIARLAEEEGRLPGLGELLLLACCQFGVTPASPHRQRELITELLQRHCLRSGPASEQSKAITAGFGVPGTEWCIVSKRWWDEWQRFASGVRRDKEPGEISNLEVVRRVGQLVQLVQDAALGVNVEAVSPEAFTALQLWHGGGPTILRRAIELEGRSVIELHPLLIRLAVYQPGVNPQQSRDASKETEILVSRASTVHEVSLGIHRRNGQIMRRAR